jgi:hypothetical protein
MNEVDCKDQDTKQKVEGTIKDNKSKEKGIRAYSNHTL